jgi:cell division protein FtsL
MNWDASRRIRPRIHNIPLEKERDPHCFRDVTLFLLILLFLTAPMLLHVAWQARCVKARYSVEALRREKSSLDQQYLRLRVERATLESLDRVAAKAGGELGLLLPQAGARIVVPPKERSAGEALVASAEPAAGTTSGEAR